MMRIRRLGLAILAATCMPHAMAADIAMEEEEMALVYGDKTTVSIATGSRQSLRRAPAVTTVITAEDIAAMGARDLDDVLESVPGLHVSRSANAYGPLYLIRGIHSSLNPQTLMLQNGVPMTVQYTGNRGNIWAGFPVENIARIEVIRGPGSALYGADAYSGVINIITKQAAEVNGTEFGLRGGSFDTIDTWINHGQRVGDVEVAAFLRYSDTDGDDSLILRDAQTRNDTLFGTRVSRAPGKINLAWEAVDVQLGLGFKQWRLNAGYKGRETGTAAGIGSALDPVGRMRSRRSHVDVSWQEAQVSENLGAGATASFFHYAQTFPTILQLLPPGARLPTGQFPQGMQGAPEFWERQLRLSGYLIYTGLKDHRLRLGLGHDDLDLYKTRELKNFTFNRAGTPVPAGDIRDYTAIAPFLTPQQRRVSYAYLQDEWQLARDLAITAGVRMDDFSDFGRTTNPRLAIVWDSNYDLTFKFLFGRAFRAPSFNEQYSINNPVLIGNRNLKPETIRTGEAVVNWLPKPGLALNFSAYRYKMNDIIRAVPNSTPGTGNTANNTGAQTSKGAEIEAQWSVSSTWKLSANLAFQDSTDKASQRDPGYTPRRQLSINSDWAVGDGWAVAAQAHHIADRKRAPGDARAPLDDYTQVDLTLRKAISKGRWQFALSARNVFDEDIREPSLAPGLALPDDLPQSGRTVFLQVSYRL